MKNPELQKALDKRKYLESQAKKVDLAGAMPYCSVCEFSVTCETRATKKRCDYGGTTGDFDKVPYPCATAYNRMVRNHAK